MKNFNLLSWLLCLLFIGLCLSLASCGSNNESTDYRVRNNLALVDTNGEDNTSAEEVDAIDGNQIVMCLHAEAMVQSFISTAVLSLAIIAMEGDHSL